MLKWLTKQQQKLEKEFWVKYKLNKDKKMYLETNYKYEKYLIEKRFKDIIKLLTAWYTQAEIDTWKTKVEEAEKVITWWTSNLLNSLLIEWEKSQDLAKSILQKAKEYSKIYLQAEKEKRQSLSDLIIKFKIK